MTEIIVAAIAMLGTVAGSFGGILATNRLLNYRIGQLEKKVEQQTGLLETMLPIMEQMKSVKHRINDLEQWQKEVRHERKDHEIAFS